jgi:hypothetical protein
VAANACALSRAASSGSIRTIRASGCMSLATFSPRHHHSQF